jgi:hypothetical protein
MFLRRASTVRAGIAGLKPSSRPRCGFPSGNPQHCPMAAEKSVRLSAPCAGNTPKFSKEPAPRTSLFPTTRVLPRVRPGTHWYSPTGMGILHLPARFSMCLKSCSAMFTRSSGFSMRRSSPDLVRASCCMTDVNLRHDADTRGVALAERPRKRLRLFLLHEVDGAAAKSSSGEPRADEPRQILR